MTALIVTVFLASLLGSLHCAGMCGAFVALCVGGAPRTPGAHALVQSAYHGGRLITYACLGAIAGGVGAALDLGGGLLGVQRAALVLAGVAMIVFGVITVLRLRGVRVPQPPLPGFLHRLVLSGHQLAHRRTPAVRALLIGLFSTLLPCGWLYAFAVTAAGTASVTLGALTMAIFWLGTLPVLVGLGVGLQTLAGPLRRHVPVATAIALIIVGVVAISGRLRVPALNASELAAAEVGSIDAMVDRTVALDAEAMPCCNDGP